MLRIVMRTETAFKYATRFGEYCGPRKAYYCGDFNSFRQGWAKWNDGSKAMFTYKTSELSSLEVGIGFYGVELPLDILKMASKQPLID